MAEEKKTQVKSEEKAAAEEQKQDTASSEKEVQAEAGEKASEEKTEATAAGAEEKAEEVSADEEKAKEEPPKVELSGKMGDIIETIEKLSVLELSELVKAMEDRFGVSAQAPVAVAGAVPGAAAGGGDAAEEEKSLFTVELTDVGAKKINVIKEVRALTDLGLKEAKELVESAPCTVKADLLKDEAEKMKKQLEDAGAKVELK